MVIEDFDFNDFYDPNKRYLKAKKVYYCGVGAVTVITPNQCVTRWNSPEIDEEDNLTIGLGTHPNNLRNIVSQMIETGDLSVSEFSEKETTFMSDNIFILYVNGDVCNVLFHFPNRISKGHLKGIEFITSRLEKVLPMLKELDVITDSDNIRGVVAEVNDFSKILEIARNSVDEYYKSETPENIIVEKRVEFDAAGFKM